MASLDRIEGDALESAGWIVFIGIVILIILGYLAAKDVAIPTTWYPDVAFGRFASWIDEIFQSTPISGGKTQSSVDNWLAGIFGWINRNLPRAASSKGWGDYQAQFNEPPGSIETGDAAGTGSANDQFAQGQSSVVDYSSPDSSNEISDLLDAGY